MQIFRCGTLFTPMPEPSRRCVLADQGKIVDLLTPAQADAVNGAEVVSLDDCIVGPGLVDMHCHGAMGSDFADGTEEDIGRAAGHHLRHGTTTLLATIGSCSLAEMLRACATVRALKPKMPNLAGIHLEGPYFNPKWQGCHLPEMVRNPERPEWMQLEPFRDVIRMVTLAPELPGALDLIREYVRSGTVFSIGHSAATYAEIDRAIDAGLTHSTHLFCAMPRAERIELVMQPGVLETLLMRDELSVEIIADGIHVGARLIELAHRIKGTDRMALISDALRGVGCPPGEYAFGPRNGKMCRLSDNPRVGIVPDRPGILASSAIVLSDAFGILGRQTRLSLAEIWAMASLTPAKILGLKGKGSLKPGCDADLLALRPDLTVAAVYQGGRVVADRKI